MDQFSQSPMQHHELTMRQMVAQIHLGKLNLDQATVPFQVNRKTVRHWVNKVEQEADNISQTAAQQPIQKKTAVLRSPSPSEDQAHELRARVNELE